ncbi:DUF86 domain-containing protein [Candidatus Woesearchaeota archaeon]|nr:DUF86 domain-containing protein [Candidatus Woesearchaeota archaeon]
MLFSFKDKIEEVEQYLEELTTFLPDDFEVYEHNVEKKAACERYFEKIVESLVDISFLVLKEEGGRIPEEDTQAFDLLSKKEIILEALSTRLKEAKGMRNILAHEYGIVDDRIVFESITSELVEDTKTFLNAIKKYLRGKK